MSGLWNLRQLNLFDSVPPEDMAQIIDIVHIRHCHRGEIVFRPGDPCNKFYTVVHQPHRPRLPAEPLPAGALSCVLGQALFDDALNEKYFHKVAATCYYPAIEQFQALLQTVAAR